VSMACLMVMIILAVKYLLVRMMEFRVRRTCMGKFLTVW
jgi:hypothetical protein